MFREVFDPIDALVTFKPGFPHPRLDAFRWGGRRLDVSNTERIETARQALYYVVRALGSRYALRFDLDRSRWLLEAIDTDDVGNLEDG